MAVSRCPLCGVLPFAGTGPCVCGLLDALDAGVRRYSRGVAECEVPGCGRKAFWWLWAEGYPRHAVCASDLEAVSAKLATQPSLVGRLRIEPIDPHHRERSTFPLTS